MCFFLFTDIDNLTVHSNVQFNYSLFKAFVHAHHKENETKYFQPHCNYHKVSLLEGPFERLQDNVKNNTYNPGNHFTVVLYCVMKKEKVQEFDKLNNFQNAAIRHVETNDHNEEWVATNVLTTLSSGLQGIIFKFIDDLKDVSIHKKDGIQMFCDKYNEMLRNFKESMKSQKS